MGCRRCFPRRRIRHPGPQGFLAGRGHLPDHRPGGIFFTDSTLWALDVDYHWNINTESGTSRFYPLAGLDFKFTSDHAKFGLNLGGGANFMLTEKMAAFVELKYVISDWDGFGIAAGIYF